MYNWQHVYGTELKTKKLIVNQNHLFDWNHLRPMCMHEITDNVSHFEWNGTKQIWLQLKPHTVFSLSSRLWHSLIIRLYFWHTIVCLTELIMPISHRITVGVSTVNCCAWTWIFVQVQCGNFFCSCDTFNSVFTRKFTMITRGRRRKKNSCKAYNDSIKLYNVKYNQIKICQKYKQ